jgi:CRISPR-associated endonuclease/helicase Cas3
MSKKSLIANTNNQNLAMHSFAIGVVAVEQLKDLNINEPKFLRSTFITGASHDIGKVDPDFQEYLSNKIKGKRNKTIDWRNKPRHNELSVILIDKYLKGEALYNNEKVKIKDKAIRHAVLYHHERPYRGSKYISEKDLKDKISNYNTIKGNLTQFINDINSIKYNGHCIKIQIPKCEDDSEDYDQDDNFPKFKEYAEYSNVNNLKRDIANNAKLDVVRNVVISADRIISSLSNNDLEKHFKNEKLHTLIK